MTHARSLPRRRRAALMAPLVLGGVAVAAQPALAGEVAPQPNLTIEKLAQKGAAPGELAHWTVRVTNEGEVDAKGDVVRGAAVPVEDVIVRDAPASKDPLVPDEAPKSGVLLPGESLVYTVATRAERSQCDTGVTNTATVELAAKSGLVESRTDDNAASAWAPVYCWVDVALAKTSDRATYSPGDTIDYLITVTNVGHYDIALADVHVSDPDLPALGLVPEEAKDGKARTVLAPGESARYTGSRVLGAAECGPVSNTAHVELRDEKKKAGIDEAHLSNNVATHTVDVEGGVCTPAPVPPKPPVPPLTTAVGAPVKASPPPSCPRVTLRTRIAGPAMLKGGAKGAFRVTVVNTGANRAHGTSLRVAIPSGMAVIGRSPKGARMRGGSLVWNLGSISGYGRRTVRVSVRADATASGAKAARAFVAARCAARAVTSRTVTVAAVRAVVQPAVTG
jgi:uncharacterized repeat protein (TIGR01451 family)